MDKLTRNIFGFSEEPKIVGTETFECQGCEHYDPDRYKCLLFEMLNDKTGTVFAIDERVEETNYCEAYQKMRSTIKNMKRRSEGLTKKKEQESKERQGAKEFAIIA